MAAATISERRPCRFTGVARATVRCRVVRDDTVLKEQHETLAIQKTALGISPPALAFGARRGARESQARTTPVSRGGVARAAPAPEACEPRPRAAPGAHQAQRTEVDVLTVCPTDP